MCSELVFQRKITKFHFAENGYYLLSNKNCKKKKPDFWSRMVVQEKFCFKQHRTCHVKSQDSPKRFDYSGSLKVDVTIGIYNLVKNQMSLQLQFKRK